jgi:hypothetical protein
MSKITKGDGTPPPPKPAEATIRHGVPEGAATEESHGGYGGTDRLQSEAAPLHPVKEGK